MAPSRPALYEELDDLQLSWTEAELPDRERLGLHGRGGEGAQQGVSSGCYFGNAIESERGVAVLRRVSEYVTRAIRTGP